MLTQETIESLHNGIIVPINIRRVADRYLSGQLACGVEANVALANMFDPSENNSHPSTVFHFGQTVQGVILDINYSKFSAELSTADSAIKDAQEKKRRTQKKDPKYWNVQAEDADKSKAALKRKPSSEQHVLSTIHCSDPSAPNKPKSIWRPWFVVMQLLGHRL